VIPYWGCPNACMLASADLGVATNHGRVERAGIRSLFPLGLPCNRNLFKVEIVWILNNFTSNFFSLPPVGPSRLP
jgi:hypothetical protein